MARLTEVVPALGVGPDQTADAGAWTNVLAEVPLFAGLSKRQLRKVAATARIARFHDGRKITRTGEPGDVFYALLDGEVTVTPRRGLPSVQLGAGSFFGEIALLDGGPRSATVAAKGPVVCLAINRTRFLKLLRTEPTITLAILEELARRLRAVHASA